MALYVVLAAVGVFSVVFYILLKDSKRTIKDIEDLQTGHRYLLDEITVLKRRLEIPREVNLYDCHVKMETQGRMRAQTKSGKELNNLLERSGLN